MSMKNVRRLLLFIPVALAVACSGPTGPGRPAPPPDPPPGDNPPANSVMQPTVHDTLNVVPS